MKVWHDDVRPAPPGWEWARTNAEARKLLSENHVTDISLDHDLGYHDVEMPDDPDDLLDVLQAAGPRAGETGLDLVEWMCHGQNVPENVTVHSWNPVGAQNMAARFMTFGYRCRVVPYQGFGPYE